MTSFASLLSSISGQAPAPVAQPPPNVSKPIQRPSATGGQTNPPSGTSLTANNAVAGVKRKSDDVPAIASAKVTKIESNNISNRPLPQTNQVPRTTKPAVTPGTTTTSYRGTARPAANAAANSASARPMAKPITKPTQPTAAASSVSAQTSANAPAKPKRGFAALMEKAKASQEATTLAVASGIKHKPAEKVSRREREKMLKEAALQQQRAKKAGRSALQDISQTGARPDGKTAPSKKPPELGYKGTMRKSAPELGYKGTMRAGGSGQANPKPVAKKGMGQDKYGGYASWSDLDDAEDDEEEDYESDASSDMEGGFDDLEREEIQTLRVARKEDQEAMEEEERHRREKLERKKRLQALNKNAAAKRRI